MEIIYISQANISLAEYSIHKGEAITEEAYNALPERLKLKFRQGTSPSEPAGRNEIIGDSDFEKTKREQLSKKDLQTGQELSDNKIKIRRNRKGI